MAIDVWFPLAIYYVDLPEGAAHKDALVQRIRKFMEAAVEKRTSAQAAWTGDVHGVDRIHSDVACAWLTDQVGRHAKEYLRALGHDLSKTDLYIQRSWPVVSQKGQFVSRHAHYTSHVSAVYYVSVPEGNCGQTRFYNDSRQNEVSMGIGSNMTSGYSNYNPLNFQSAVYSPVEGRLLLFPAKQTHDVGANETEEDRISISYDLVLASCVDATEGGYEFMMPPPNLWQKVPAFERNPAELQVASTEAGV